MKSYAVIFETSRTGWGAYVPDLPGLAAVGSTFEETEQLMREAIELHLGAMLEDGDSIPEPSTRVLTMQPEILERRPLAKSA